MITNNNSLFGIGLDIVNVDVFEKLIHDKKRAWKIYFTKKELDYCYKKSHPEQHLAGVFAAKEAIIKAMNKFKLKLIFSKIEIGHIDLEPSAVIGDINKEYQICLSITHNEEVAAAIAFINKI